MAGKAKDGTPKSVWKARNLLAPVCLSLKKQNQRCFPGDFAVISSLEEPHHKTLTFHEERNIIKINFGFLGSLTTIPAAGVILK